MLINTLVDLNVKPRQRFFGFVSDLRRFGFERRTRREKSFEGTRLDQLPEIRRVGLEPDRPPDQDRGVDAQSPNRRTRKSEVSLVSNYVKS